MTQLITGGRVAVEAIPLEVGLGAGGFDVRGLGCRIRGRGLLGTSANEEPDDE